MAARSLNRAQIIGNLTRDPDLRYTAQGTPICTFGVATNRVYRKANSDEAIEETEFHNVVAWGKLAELCNQLLHKGWKTFIGGRLQTRSWEDAETGKKMYRTEIVALDMIVLGAPRGAVSSEGTSTSEVEAVTTSQEQTKSTTEMGVSSKGAGDQETEQAAEGEKEIPF